MRELWENGVGGDMGTFGLCSFSGPGLLTCSRDESEMNHFLETEEKLARG